MADGPTLAASACTARRGTSAAPQPPEVPAVKQESQESSFAAGLTSSLKMLAGVALPLPAAAPIVAETVARTAQAIAHRDHAHHEPSSKQESKSVFSGFTDLVSSFIPSSVKSFVGGFFDSVSSSISSVFRSITSMFGGSDYGSTTTEQKSLYNSESTNLFTGVLGIVTSTAVLEGARRTWGESKLAYFGETTDRGLYGIKGTFEDQKKVEKEIVTRTSEHVLNEVKNQILVGRDGRALNDLTQRLKNGQTLQGLQLEDLKLPENSTREKLA